MQLSAQGSVFHDVIFRNDAWFTEPYHAKDLRLLGRNMDRVVIFDNAPNCCKINKAHSVLVEDFTGYYNPGDNTIVFDGYAVPPAGARIEVSYALWKGPLEEQEEAAE